MNQERFKQQLTRDKEWHRSLYESDSSEKTKNLINFASDGKLETLIKFIHLLLNGIIKILKAKFGKIGKDYMRLIKKNFESKIALNRVLKCERITKVKTLIKLIPVLSLLLYTLFNQQ